MSPLTWYAHTRYDQRLSVDVSVYRVGEQFTEVADVHVGWRQDGLVGIGSLPGIIIMPGQGGDGGRVDRGGQRQR